MERGWSKHAEGSVLVSFGDTKVFCTATVTEGVPRWRKGQRRRLGTPPNTPCCLTAPPHTRGDRESVRGKLGGRTHEILPPHRPRPARASDRTRTLGENTIVLDCGASLQADGGIPHRAAITGAYVALADAVSWAQGKKLIQGRPPPLTGTVSADVPSASSAASRLLDLRNEEDVRARDRQERRLHRRTAASSRPSTRPRPSRSPATNSHSLLDLAVSRLRGI
ncbi:ribonuclease PH [Streptomyces sp. B21-106]|uniref:ribonuclease PH n=1 Tax=Streptomyces sp. B21-106 TaxID=3039418 RepID=UPI002FEF6F40